KRLHISINVCMSRTYLLCLLAGIIFIFTSLPTLLCQYSKISASIFSLFSLRVLIHQTAMMLMLRHMVSWFRSRWSYWRHDRCNVGGLVVGLGSNEMFQCPSKQA